MEKKRAGRLNQCGSRTGALPVKCSSNIRNVDGVLLYNELWREANSIYEKWAKCRGLSYCELLFCLSLEEESAVRRIYAGSGLWQSRL